MHNSRHLKGSEMKTQPTEGNNSEYFDELLERASDGYDPYGYIEDNTMGLKPSSSTGSVYDFDWGERERFREKNK